MVTHFKRLAVLVAAVCTLALGGAVVAQASNHSRAHHAQSHRVVHRAHRTGTQQTGESTETAEGSESTESDGPGGHEDPTGAEVVHEFEGEE